MATKAQQAEQEQAREALRAMISPGDTLYTVLRHVSQSGMSRSIDVYRMSNTEHGPIDPEWLSRRIARACGFTFDERREAIKMGGAGQDMGYAIIHELGYFLWPDGFECVGEGDGYGSRCPSNDHSNGDRNYEPHHHSSAGYALHHRWI